MCACPGNADAVCVDTNVGVDIGTEDVVIAINEWRK